MIQDELGLITSITSQIKQSMDLAVLGMSGGADSSLTAVLAFLALGPTRVYSVHMPASPTDEHGFNATSMALATRLGIHRLRAPVGDLAALQAAVCQTALGVEELSRLNQGNARARARMAVLYGIAHHLGDTSGQRVRVLGTGNLSEDFIGYDTKGGDALADIFPIGELFKSEVYQLLDHFRDKGLIAESMIDRVPSAGLWEGQTDEQELGHTYQAMEPAIRKIRSPTWNPAKASAIESFVWERHLAHKHKHEAPPVIKVRQFCD